MVTLASSLLVVAHICRYLVFFLDVCISDVLDFFVMYFSVLINSIYEEPYQSYAN
jgi:hypothetical protein